MRPGVADRILAGLAAILLPIIANSAEVRSPDQRISFEVGVDEDGTPSYSVRYRDEAIIGKSRVGLRFEQSEGLQASFSANQVSSTSSDSVWEQPWGERRYIRDHYNEILVRFKPDDGTARHFDIRVRVHDDGVGFRYEFDGTGDVSVDAELTEFSFEGGGTAWWQPADGKVRYEHLYRGTPITEMEKAHTPVTIVMDDGVHVAVHEAALVNYAAYALAPNDDGSFVTVLRPWSDGVAVKTSRPFKTPWRTLQIADDSSGLLNSNLILNLNEQNELGDVSWIKLGKYVGIWWEMHLGLKTWDAGPQHGATTERAKHYIDFAAEHGFAGVLVEGWNQGWHGPFSYTEAYPDYDIEAVAAYAKDHGVYMIGHHETYGDVASYEEQMEAGFDVLATLGVPQVKTGYVADAGRLRRVDDDGQEQLEWHDGQYAVDHQLRNLSAAAKREIAVNTHEPVKDTGLRRTWPNWLTREGSRGQEFAIWGETPNPPEHTVLLVHTRMLGGPMDFTPGMFDLHPRRGDVQRRVQTTLAKQLALYVVLYSPMQMVPDLPENYAAHPNAFQFVIDVPTDWEESVALAGEVGDYVVMARKERGGGDWYLGAISDEKARSVSVPLTMLDAGIDYAAEIYRDSDDAHWDSNPYAVEIERQTLTNESTLELRLAAGGGTAIRFRPQEKASQQ